MALSPLQIVALVQLAVVEPTTYNGFSGQLRVRAPALDAAVVVDGSLNEPVWQRAALLTGGGGFRGTRGRIPDFGLSAWAFMIKRTTLTVSASHPR